MNDSPSITVVVPVFNRAQVLPRAVESVLSQSFQGFELIVVDDGSTDDTRHLAERWNDSRVRWLHQVHGGVSRARNAGLTAARGRCVVFLDSDDEAMPGWLGRIATLLSDPEVGIATVGARVIERDSTGRIVRDEVRLPQSGDPLYACQPLVYTAGSLATRCYLLREIGGYLDGLAFAENSELAMRLVPACLRRGLRVAASDEPLVTYHRERDAWRSTPDRFAALRNSAELILERHGARMRSVAPAGYANYCGVAAVNAARLGDLGAARRHLLAGVSALPWRAKSYLRIGLTLVPPLARRVWRHHGSTCDPEGRWAW